MSEAQDGTVEPFGLYDPTKVDKPLAAADVQSLIDASITDKFDAFRAELLQVLKPVTGDRADGADTRAPSTPARGGGTAVTAGSRTAKSTAGDLLGLSSGAASATREATREAQQVTCSFPLREGERRWVLLKIPRCDIDGLGEEQ